MLKTKTYILPKSATNPINFSSFMFNIIIYLLRCREAENRRQKRLNKTHSKQISVISHNRKRLDQVWKLIQKIDVEIHEFGEVSEIQIKFGSLFMKLAI